MKQTNTERVFLSHENLNETDQSPQPLSQEKQFL